MVSVCFIGVGNWKILLSADRPRVPEANSLDRIPNMGKKIIIDCDPGIGDAVALCAALFDPDLDVLAVTATGGTIPADRATLNVRALVELLDPPRYPRLGAASATKNAPVIDDSQLHGPNGLAGLELPVSGRQHQHPSEKVIAELIRLYPGEITVVCLGPLTNVARVLQREPGLAQDFGRILISGGAVTHPGNVMPGVEFNMFFDPSAAEIVFQSATTKTLIPLDASTQVSFGLDLMEDLPSRATRAGQLLHPLLQFAFRKNHQLMGRESIPLYDPVTLLAVLEPELFTWTDMAADVETGGRLARGQTMFDRRSPREWSFNMEVAQSVDVEVARLQVIRRLRFAGQMT